MLVDKVCDDLLLLIISLTRLTHAIQLAHLEKEVKERAKRDATKDQAEAEQPIINPGGFGTLLLTQGAVGTAPAPYTNGTGVPVSICRPFFSLDKLSLYLPYSMASGSKASYSRHASDGLVIMTLRWFFCVPYRTCFLVFHM